MVEKYRIKGLELTRKNLLSLEKNILRSLIHERTHHTIEAFLYQIQKGNRKPPKDFGNEVRILVDVWKERKFSMKDPDIRWTVGYLDLVETIRSGALPNLKGKVPEPFKEKDLEAVDNLLFARRSIRQWKKKRVPKMMVRRIMEAGLAAPNACNMQCQRFIVLDDKDKTAMLLIKADVPVPPVKIVICQDMRIYEWMGFPDRSPQNIYFDAAAAADHMLLMVHALGLGGVWLTHSKKQADKLRKHLGLPKYLRMDTHIAFGWPDEAPIKSARMRLKDAMVETAK